MYFYGYNPGHPGRGHFEPLGHYLNEYCLILKAPITTAADDIHKYFFSVFQRK